jgi:hypothetical protein
MKKNKIVTIYVDDTKVVLVLTQIQYKIVTKMKMIGGYKRFDMYVDGTVNIIHDTNEQIWDKCLSNVFQNKALIISYLNGATFV